MCQREAREGAGNWRRHRAAQRGVELAVRHANREHTAGPQHLPRGVGGGPGVGQLIERVPDGDGVYLLLAGAILK